MSDIEEEVTRLAKCVERGECKEVTLGKDIYIYGKNRELIAILSSDKARRIYRRILGMPATVKIVEIPIDSFTDLVINFDPRFQTLEIRHLVGEDTESNELIANKIANKMGGKVYKTNGLIYVTIPWKPDIYYTLGSEVEEIYRIKQR